MPTARSAAPAPDSARVSARNAPGSALAETALGPSPLHGERARAPRPSFTPGGDLELLRFYTSDLFPGDVRQPDWGTRLSLRPELTWRLPGAWRLKPWARVVAERYDLEPDRDLTRWWLGLDLKRGPHRLRTWGALTRHELYFPSSTGGAWLDRSAGGVELRLGVLPGWEVAEVAQLESQDFNPIYNERDGQRWSARSIVQRAVLDGGHVALGYVYRRDATTSHLYTYGQNALRAEWDSGRTPWLDGSLMVEGAIRDYRTGLLYANNFGREDDRWRVLGRVGRPVFGPLRADLTFGWRSVRSTRITKGYDVSELGLAVTATR